MLVLLPLLPLSWAAVMPHHLLAAELQQNGARQGPGVGRLHLQAAVRWQLPLAQQPCCCCPCQLLLLAQLHRQQNPGWQQWTPQLL